MRPPAMAEADSKERPQVHGRVERGDFRVTVEHQRLAREQFAQSALPCLTPAWMIDRGIYVRIETVLLRCQLVPGGCRLPFREPNAHDGLDALETILPRQGQAQRRAILIR